MTDDQVRRLVRARRAIDGKGQLGDDGEVADHFAVDEAALVANQMACGATPEQAKAYAERVKADPEGHFRAVMAAEGIRSDLIERELAKARPKREADDDGQAAQ